MEQARMMHQQFPSHKLQFPKQSELRATDGLRKNITATEVVKLFELLTCKHVTVEVCASLCGWKFTDLEVS